MEKRHRKLMTIGIVFVVVALISGITYKTISSRTFQVFGGIVSRINTDKKVVALTFDDGPSQKTDSIIAILKKNNIKATFFLIGAEVEKYPEETKKLIIAGQEIGNHTFSHKRMVFKSPSYIAKEIEKTDTLIKKLGYEDTIQFRPPNGKKLFFLPYYLKKHHRSTIMWDIEPNSFPEINSGSKKITQYVLDNVKPGSIILLHVMNDEKGNTINALEAIIRGLKNKGYEFKTINELKEYTK